MERISVAWNSRRVRDEVGLSVSCMVRGGFGQAVRVE